MELHRALLQISEIHTQIDRLHRYRSFRSLPVAFTAVVAFLSGMAYNSFPLAGAHQGFVLFWVAAGIVAFTIGFLEVGYHYVVTEDQGRRRVTRLTLCQYLPAIFTAAGLTAGIFLYAPEHTLLLPAIWACLNGLGLLSARLHLPQGIGWVALFYVACGIASVFFIRDIYDAAFAMMCSFGIGQTLMTLVIFADKQRTLRHA